MTARRVQTAVGRVSVQTPVGRGAIAVVAVAGPGVLAAVDRDFQAASGKPLCEQRIGRVCFGRFAGEEVVVCRISETAAEVHCHGGRYAAGRIVDRLTAAGCLVEPWETWTDAGGEPTIASEAIRALAVARTAPTAAILLDQHNGALADAVQQAATLLAAGELSAGRRAVELLHRRYAVGRRLTERLRIVIAGLPNVGKSSLINALLGYRRAIVADLAGTTRDVVAAEAAIAGWPVQLIDAAGLRSTADPLEAAGVELAREQLVRADVVLWVVDATELSAASEAEAEAAAGRQRAGWRLPAETPVATVVNKIDRLPSPGWPAAADTMGVSARDGVGIDRLVDHIVQFFVPGRPAPGTAVPFTARHAALLGEALAELDRQNHAAAAGCLRRLCLGA